ncbi:hypothetical protein HUT16_19730 [Kitasatospora sp. NA04385]|uniref:hypothetical protein n=1 Tax=Kitasatospora sp. NA04385 TaxID=2742135 RepID=UPI0015903060|nr:hypothetical protein [Kitasatospora sp. NA04385]QKW20988.1 hypothetical protein HUT16_19730 [Kitasatospora sp. NA04385]
MKKRSLLAFASLAVGVVASLTAPSAHAAPEHSTGLGPLKDAVSAPDLPVAEGLAQQAATELPGV